MKEKLKEFKKEINNLILRAERDKLSVSSRMLQNINDMMDDLIAEIDAYEKTKPQKK